MVIERGEVCKDEKVRHRYDGARITHWNTEHVGDKYSVIVHNNKTTLTWKNFDAKNRKANKKIFN